MEELIANGCLSQLHDKVIHCSHSILNFAGVVSGDFVRLHLFSVRLLKLGRELLVFLFRDQVLAKFILWITDY